MDTLITARPASTNGQKGTTGPPSAHKGLGFRVWGFFWVEYSRSLYKRRDIRKGPLYLSLGSMDPYWPPQVTGPLNPKPGP